MSLVNQISLIASCKASPKLSHSMAIFKHSEGASVHDLLFFSRSIALNNSNLVGGSACKNVSSKSSVIFKLSGIAVVISGGTGKVVVLF